MLFTHQKELNRKDKKMNRDNDVVDSEDNFDRDEEGIDEDKHVDTDKEEEGIDRSNNDDIEFIECGSYNESIIKIDNEVYDYESIEKGIIFLIKKKM